jgi:hypothetical protein
VTQGGALPAGDDSGHPAGFLGERDMPDRVHTGVKAVQVGPRDPTPDRGIVDPYGDELAPAHHRVLPRRDPREPHVRVCAENLSPSD